MQLFSNASMLARVAGSAVLLMALASSCKSQTPQVVGQYVCSEARVAGKVVPCKAAPLSLKKDGRFELQGREGDYVVKGHWVELQSTLQNSRAKIEDGHKIVFRFYNRKGLCEMIYERRIAELGKTNLS